MLKAAAEVGQGHHLGSAAATTHVSRLGNITTETLTLTDVRARVRVIVYGDSLRTRLSAYIDVEHFVV